MPNPIPSRIRLLTKAPIRSRREWVRRTRRASEILIRKHGYREEDFFVVSSNEDKPSLDMAGIYPSSWADKTLSGLIRSWVDERRMPKGLVIYNAGPDYWGEGSDDEDPILLLAGVSAWEALTDDELVDMANAPLAVESQSVLGQHDGSLHDDLMQVLGQGAA